MQKYIIFRGTARIVPCGFVSADGRILDFCVDGNTIFINGKLASNHLLESLVPYDLTYVTEYEKMIRTHYYQVVKFSGSEVFPAPCYMDKLPENLYVAIPDWLGDGRLVDFDPVEWISSNIYDIRNLPIDRKLKAMKYMAGPMCPAVFPYNMKISYKDTGHDHLGTIYVNPEVARNIRIKHKYPPYDVFHLMEGTKIRGPFIKGTVVYNRNVEGICFLSGSWKTVSAESAIKAGFWIETLPFFLCNNKVTISYTMYEHITDNLRNYKSVDKIFNLTDREKLFKKLIFTDRDGNPQKMRVVEAIRNGLPINYGSTRRYIYQRITDELDKRLFNPVVPGIRAVGIELDLPTKEVVIPKIFADTFKIGEKVVLYRDPVSWKGAIQLARVKGYTESPVIMLTPRMAHAMQGDFDGDQYNIVKRSLIDKMFDIDIVKQLSNTPRPTDYPVSKDTVSNSCDKNEIYRIALMVEVAKQSTGMMVHIRDNAVFRKLCDDKTVEYIYHTGAQQVLQSKNAIVDVDYRNYPFEVARIIAKNTGLNDRDLTGKNNSLNIIRKRILFGQYRPEKRSKYYNDLLKYTVEPFREFSPLAVVEIALDHYNIPDNQLSSCRKIIYDVTTLIDETNIRKRAEMIINECRKRRYHKYAPVIALMQIMGNKPNGFPYEYVVATEILAIYKDEDERLSIVL